MKKILFLLSLCLLPFVVFSSTFSSQNPIELPSDNSDPVLDTNGNALSPRARYRIVSIGWGALGGDVYLGPYPNSSVPCNNGVFRHNSDVGRRGTPLTLLRASSYVGPHISENQDLNILFSIPVENMCVPYIIWKVGDFDVSLGARLLETGGTVQQQDSSWFRIVKAASLGYNLLYCPGPFVCPSCPLNQCQAVGEVNQDGKRRLALVNDSPLAVNFLRLL